MTTQLIGEIIVYGTAAFCLFYAILYKPEKKEEKELKSNKLD